MKTALRNVAVALSALTLLSTAACISVATSTAKGTVTRYNLDPRSSGSAFFELEGMNGVFYCDVRTILKCATTVNGDKVDLTYYANAYGWLYITELKRVE